MSRHAAPDLADPLMKRLNIERGAAPETSQDAPPAVWTMINLNHEQPQTPGSGRTPPDRDKINP
jgi:hypothetical protein